MILKGVCGLSVGEEQEVRKWKLDTYKKKTRNLESSMEGKRKGKQFDWQVGWGEGDVEGMTALI